MSEAALLVAVRDNLRELCGYTPAQCEIEIDEEAPPTSGDLVVLVMPGGWTFGSAAEGGDVLDELYGVKVMVAMRLKAVPQDRQRQMLIDTMFGLEKHTRQIIAKTHMSYRVQQKANENIVDGPEGFVEPLRFAGMEPKPRPLGADFFKAVQGSEYGIGRTVLFHQARRIQTQSTAV